MDEEVKNQAMRPLTDQTILVTGSTDGMGRALAIDLASRGARVLVHGRSEDRLDAVGEAVRRAAERGGSDYGGLGGSYCADLSSLDEVRRLAAEVLRDQERLDVLVNNAGIGAGTLGAMREVSADGYELRLAVNYLAPFLLTHLLLPLLRRSAPARIVNVSSVGQEEIDFEDLMLERGYSGMRAYRQSKLALILFTFDLAERLAAEEAGVTVNALHPATLMDTKMVQEWFGYSISTVEQGVEATRRLAVGPELSGVSGVYFDVLDEARAHDQAYDPRARRRLWELSERLVGTTDPGEAEPPAHGG